MRAAGKQGLSVIIAPSGADRDQELSLLRGPRTHMSDGILFSALALGEADAHLLTDVSDPMVLLGERIFHGPKDHVTMRNSEGAHAATTHLLSLGRRADSRLRVRSAPTVRVGGSASHWLPSRP